MPVRPPKKWFYRTVASIKKHSPEIKDPKALAGWIWHYWATRKRKREILKEEKGHGINPRKKVIEYKDYPVSGLIRLLKLEDGSYFPEYALYEARKAGLKEDFIKRSKDFNLFVYK